MKDARGFLAFLVVNSAVLYIAPYLLVGQIVVGNVRLTAFMASIISGFLLTIADSVIQPIFTSLGIKLKEDWQWLLVYLFVNVVGIWVIARYADLTGVGVASAWMAVLLGAVLNAAQWATWKLVSGNKK